MNAVLTFGHKEVRPHEAKQAEYGKEHICTVACGLDQWRRNESDDEVEEPVAACGEAGTLPTCQRLNIINGPLRQSPWLLEKMEISLQASSMAPVPKTHRTQACRPEA
jgi:hypothetical protein